MLGDHESAILAFEAAREADEENEDAGTPLVDEYITRADWVKAEPVLDMLVRKASKLESAAINISSGTSSVKSPPSSEKTTNHSRRIQRHLQLDLTDQSTIRGLAEVTFRLKDWGASLTNFQKVLTALTEDETEERANVYYKLGCIKREQQQAKQAINNFEKALARRLRAQADTRSIGLRSIPSSKTGNRSSLTSAKSWTTSLKRNDRYNLLLEVADVWNDNDKNPQKAIEALEEAKDIKPSDLAAPAQDARALPSDRELGRR